MVLNLILVAFVWGMIAFAVAFDASNRGHHAGFWALLTFLGGPFGALLYVGVALFGSGESTDGTGGATDATPETVRVCPDCASRHDDTPDNCPDCGTKLGPDDDHPIARRLQTGSERYCSNCKSEVSRRVNTCRSCGAVF